MRLGIEITGRCNAACLHCSSACGPTRRDQLSTNEILAVMDQAYEINPGQLEFVLTGGEPFLDRRRLRELIAHGTSLGAIVSCVSNGFWASSMPRALDVLGPLKEAGLRMIGISTSRFHRQYVAGQRVELAIAAAGQLGIRTVLKIAITKSDRYLPPESPVARAEASADMVEHFAVIGSGRDPSAIDESEWITSETIPVGRCPSTAASIAEDGRYMACASSGPASPAFAFGNIRDTPLRDCAKRLSESALHRQLRSNGPASFLPAIIHAGLSSKLRPAYHDVCDLCTHLLSNAEMVAVCKQQAETFAVTH